MLSVHYKIKEVIEKVRVVIRKFRKSPTKNDDILQKWILEEHNKILTLLLDCKTRWNSTLVLVNRFF